VAGGPSLWWYLVALRHCTSDVGHVDVETDIDDRSIFLHPQIYQLFLCLNPSQTCRLQCRWPWFL
jgi:hypothetical protein